MSTRSFHWRIFVALLASVLILWIVVGSPGLHMNNKPSKDPTVIEFAKRKNVPKESPNQSEIIKEKTVSRWITGVNRSDIPAYALLNKVLFDMNKEEYARNSESLIKAGFGLDPFATEEGEDALIENGVVYRSHPYLEPIESKFFYPKFEPYIPFDPEVFFLGEKDKIENYKKMSTGEEGKKRHGGRKIINRYIQSSGWPRITEPQPLRWCPDLPCALTTEKAFLKESAALVIDGQLINTDAPKREKDQVYVYYEVEPPTSMFWAWGGPQKRQGWLPAFNWTLSHRMDSDIMLAYGLIRKRRQPIIRNYTEIVAKKAGIVAWLSSNNDIESKRNEYVKELQKYIKVDLLKTNPECTRERDFDCGNMISEKYKFYLGLESSICEDYITEKLFRYHDLDLVVVGRAINEYLKIAPNGTFINTADFKSPKDLANRLKYLDSHDEEYIEMLREKDKYFTLYENCKTGGAQMRYSHRYESISYCQLCHRLWNLDKYQKTIPNILDWHNLRRCVKPTDI